MADFPIGMFLSTIFFKYLVVSFTMIFPPFFKSLKFVFKAAQHDDGEKIFLGKKGRFNGDDIITPDFPYNGRTTAKEPIEFYIDFEGVFIMLAFFLVACTLKVLVLVTIWQFCAQV